MSDTNSIWPNGMQVDSEGYAVFYPMGTNKIEIPKNSPHWPKGNKLIGSFVYDDDKLVGFCDTKAMTSENEGIVVMPYEYIDTEFDSIEKDSIQIHAPKANYKKASWTDGKKEDIPDVEYKYKGCKNVNEIKTVDINYLENDIVDGKWTELLSDLGNGTSMFVENENITSFTSDLSSLTNGGLMFHKCCNLKTFDCELSSLNDGGMMFQNCTNLNSFTSDLSSLTNGRNMFYECPNLSTFNSILSSITNGSWMFYNCLNLTSINNDLNSLIDGHCMFYKCENLVSQNFNLDLLVDGNNMFNMCSNVTSFVSKLSSLTNGDGMFQGCSNLSIFKCSNLSSLTTGYNMFNKCEKITSFTSNLISLTHGVNMFSNCQNLRTFKSNLKSLTDGRFMFNGCNNLTSFSSDLNSLIDGTHMFAYCKLDVPSIKNIIESIDEVETADIFLGMGCDNNTTDKDLFAQEVGYSDMTTLLSALQNKGWTVTTQYNGRPSTSFSLRKPESLPVYVKLMEAIPTDEKSIYEYTSQDGSKFYNLDWFHETTGSTDGYTQFSSLEEAITTFNIKPIEK